MGKKNAPITLSPGNTKEKAENNIREPQVKQWCFTYNNYDELKLNEFKNTLNALGKWIFGYEVGEECLTQHLQGYINLNSKKSFSSLKKSIGVKELHIEKCKGSEKQNIEYCSKSGIWDSNFLEKPYIEEIETLYKWEEDINLLLKSQPDKRSVYYYFEEEGGIGKTTYQKYIFTHFKKVVVLSGKGTDMKNGVVKYLEKTGFLPEIVLINIPRSSQDFVVWSGIEEVKDMFFFSGKYESGMICGKCPHVLCFSNEEPPVGKMSFDRWRAYEIINLELKEYKLI